jgi:ATP-dependent helicase HrpB
MTGQRRFLPADLPVAGVLDDVVAASRSGAVVVTAPPGSGKTMLVPAAVLDDLPADRQLVLVQPRRLAARSVAHQIARLRGCELGAEVGYQVRFDSRTSRGTRLFVETTGIMLRRLLTDISLERLGAVVLDEFHERTVEMDLVLGLLVRLRQTIRPDLRVVVMSATLATEPVARLLGGGPACPVVAADGRLHPVMIRYDRRGDQRELAERVAATMPLALRETTGHVLVFLPGVGEIMQCERLLADQATRQGHVVHTLFGDLPPEQQDRVLDDVGARKIILSTNVAETSLTIPGITAVIDSGLVRQARVSPATGLPRLDLIPISQASAAQRAGRAGRTGPGTCWRLWDESAHHQRPFADVPEVQRGDLAGPLLQLMVLGEDEGFPWLDAPAAEAVAQARVLLHRLGAIAAVDDAATGKATVTALGRNLARLPAHPRLARLLLAGATHGVLRETSIAAALLSERDPFRLGAHGRRGPRDRVTVRSRSDVVDRVFALQAFHAQAPLPDADLELHPGGAQAVLRAAEQLYRLVDADLAPRATDPATALMQALWEAFPDRLAKLRPGSGDRATMVGGRGLRLDGGSRVRQEALLLAIDLTDSGGEASVRQASAVDLAWLDQEPLASTNLRASNMHSVEELLFAPARRHVEARLRTYWCDLLLDETPIPIRDAAAAAVVLAREAATQADRILPAADSAAGAFLARVRWLAGAVPNIGLPPLDEASLVAELPGLCLGLRSLDDVKGSDWMSTLRAKVGHDRLAEIDLLAPPSIELPNGKRHPILYEPGRQPTVAVRIQELFGVRETPRVAGGSVPVLLQLLGPNHRPQQLTSDLASFWQNTYPEVKKELRRRYPKHAWPDDPLAATATRSGLGRNAKGGS